MSSPEIRNKFAKAAYDGGLMILGCGEQSIRFRPTLDIKESDIDEGIAIIGDVLKSL